MDITGALQFADQQGPTHLTDTFDIQPIGLMKLVLPLMAALYAKMPSGEGQLQAVLRVVTRA